jgi:hypothetical protein
MKRIFSICLLGLCLAVPCFGQSQKPDIKDSTGVQGLDEKLVSSLVQHWRWQWKGGFGGSFTTWAVPANYKGHEFFVQGPRQNHQGEVIVRIQRHPKVTDEAVAWAKTLDPNKLGLDITAEKNWGVEVSKIFELREGETAGQLKTEMLKFLRAAFPIVIRLCGGKDVG